MLAKNEMDDVENGLLLLNHGVFYWLVIHVCSENNTYCMVPAWFLKR